MLKAQNYYPFSSTLPERTFSNGRFCGYRFSFNGQERDDEIAGVGNIMTAEFWEYDTRLGRRWNVDPIIKYWETPYSTFSNNPISFRDINGKDTTGGFINSHARDDFNNTYIELNSRITRIENHLKKFEDKNDLSNKELILIGSLKKQLTSYLEIKNAFDEVISNKDVKFKFYSSKNMEGGNTSEESKNNVYVRFERGEMRVIVHEIRHCYGYIQKEWNSSSTDYVDELEGWKFAMIWDASFVEQKIRESSKKVNSEQQMNFNIYRMIELEYKDIIFKDWIQHKVE